MSWFDCAVLLLAGVLGMLLWALAETLVFWLRR